MGEVQSQTMNNNNNDLHHQMPQQHTLIERICEDIASGNEGDPLEMQAKQTMDHESPHLWASTQHSISTAQDSTEQDLSGKSHKLPKLGKIALRRVKSTPNESLKDNSGYHKERMNEFIDENDFRKEIKRTYTTQEKGANESGKYMMREEDSY